MRLGGLPLSLALAACGAARTEVPVVVVRAEVKSECTGDGGCSARRVSVGHCGPNVNVSEGSGPARVVTDRKAEEIAAVLVVRHDSGDQPYDAANGGSSRGWMLLRTEPAHIEALHRPEVALYTLDESGEPSEINTALLSQRDAGLLEFRYTVDGLAVSEVHQLTLSRRLLELSSPDAPLNSCCASVPGRDLVGLLAVLGLLRAR